MSEIRVDTISEKTSANGVAIDGLTIKDGKITNLMNATLSAADLGGGLHIKSGDSGVSSVDSSYDELILERNGHVGMQLLSSTSTSGQILFVDSDAISGRIAYDHSNNAMTLQTNATEALRITLSQVLSTGGETGPDTTNGGITIDTNAEDGLAFTLKNSDVAHGFTGLAQTDSYATFGKSSGTDGGLTIQGFHEGQGFGLQLIAHCKTAGFTNSSSTGYGHLDLIARGSNGSTGDAALEDNENCMSVRNGGNVKFIVKGNGEIFSDVAANTFDTYEDAQLVRAFDLSKGKNVKGLINSKFDKYIKYNHETLADADLVGREEDGTPNHFVNVTGMQRLHNGAIWQQYEKHQRLAEAVYEMAKETLGADKADAILKKHDIKLLN